MIHAMTRRKLTVKPDKPKGSPLTPHASGQWAKRIRGKLHYFGAWDDYAAALTRYRAVASRLHAGKADRRIDPTMISVRSVCNLFLTHKQRQMESGELKPGTFADYKAATDTVVECLGGDRIVTDLTPADFGTIRHQFAQKLGPHALRRTVRMIRTLWRWAWESGIIDQPIRFGDMFSPPRMAQVRAVARIRLYTPAQIRSLLVASNGHLRAFIMLGINCGFGATDCATLRAEHVRGGFIEWVRAKTGVARRCALWRATIRQLRRVGRPDGLMFLTRAGNPWVRETTHRRGDRVEKVIQKDSIAMEFAKVCQKAGVVNLGFYTLRRTFRTVADECGDQHAVHLTMGHAVPGMAGVYVQRISDARLRAVADHVHLWFSNRQSRRSDSPADDSPSAGGSKRPSRKGRSATGDRS